MAYRSSAQSLAPPAEPDVPETLQVRQTRRGSGRPRNQRGSKSNVGTPPSCRVLLIGRRRQARRRALPRWRTFHSRHIDSPCPSLQHQHEPDAIYTRVSPRKELTLQKGGSQGLYSVEHGVPTGHTVGDESVFRPTSNPRRLFSRGELTCRSTLLGPSRRSSVRPSPSGPLADSEESSAAMNYGASPPTGIWRDSPITLSPRGPSFDPIAAFW